MSDSTSREFFKKAEDLSLLRHDILSIIESVSKGEDEPKELSKKSVVPMTRLRGNVEEAEAAEQNKELFYIMDRLSDIFGR